MRLLLILAVFSTSANATKPVAPLIKVGMLNGATATASDVKKAVATQIPTLEKSLKTETRVYRIFVKDGDPKDIVSGNVAYRELPAKDVDFIWVHAEVTARQGGPDFRVRVPLIMKKSYGILKDGHFLVKLAPLMAETSGVQTAAGSTIVDSYRLRLAEVEATTLIFLVDKQGAVFTGGN